MIRFSDVALRRGPRRVFEAASFAIHPGQRVGVVGANGAGKSSLLALVAGRLEADAGEVERPAGLTLAELAQEPPASAAPAIEYVLDGDAELRRTETDLAAARAARDDAREAALHAHLEAIDAYSAPARAGAILHGLGFAAARHRDPVTSFSGGWRVRLELARALMCRSDVMLLDEPTNHLDLDAVLWLEDWLRRYRGTLLVISHDREFLDPVAGAILHLEGGRVRLYEGDYSAFERRRAEELARTRALAERQRRERERVQAFVDRFRAKAAKARQAQSRLKALARMREIVPAHVDAPFAFEFRAPERVERPLVALEEVAAGYGGDPIVAGVSLALGPGDRVALLGANGAGKSTLVKTIAGEIAPSAGRVTASAHLAVGYFAQHRLEQLDPRESPIAHLRRLDPDAGEQSHRDWLGGFGFSGDLATGPVGPLSGGEKSRLVLALIVYMRPNLLLLDEPTNHLDLDMREALAVALQSYEGALVLVSHDRHLVRTVADELWLVAGARLSRWDDDLDGYARWIARGRRAETGRSAPAGDARDPAKSRRRAGAERRRRLQPLRETLAACERELESAGAEKARIEAALAEPALYTEDAKPRMQALLVEQGEAARTLAEAEARWLAAAEALERARVDEAAE